MKNLSLPDRPRSSSHPEGSIHPGSILEEATTLPSGTCSREATRATYAHRKDTKPHNSAPELGGFISLLITGTQRDLAKEFHRERGIVCLSEFNAVGTTAATIGRMLDDGEVVRFARGMCQLLDAPLDANHSFAEAAKRVPKGVVCLVSALAFHELTDQLPRAVWMAIGTNDWAPKDVSPPLQIMRFTEILLADDVLSVSIEGVPVKVFGVAKTIADCFRHRRTLGQSVALEGLQEAFRQRKATPA